MIRAYSEIYLNGVMKNLAALFDIAINAERLAADEFATLFASSKVAEGIESGFPDVLVGKSATELLEIILNKECNYCVTPIKRTPEYWAGWILAFAEWYLNKPFKEILVKISFSTIVSLYYPYHEADEMKTIELIKEKFCNNSKLKEIRKKRKLTQRELSLLSNVPLRTIRLYEQLQESINKASAETLQKISKTLNCSIEDLLN